MAYATPEEPAEVGVRAFHLPPHRLQPYTAWKAGSKLCTATRYGRKKFGRNTCDVAQLAPIKWRTTVSDDRGVTAIEQSQMKLRDFSV